MVHVDISELAPQAADINREMTDNVEVKQPTSMTLREIYCRVSTQEASSNPYLLIEWV